MFANASLSKPFLDRISLTVDIFTAQNGSSPRAPPAQRRRANLESTAEEHFSLFLLPTHLRLPSPPFYFDAHTPTTHRADKTSRGAGPELGGLRPRATARGPGVT